MKDFRFGTLLPYMNQMGYVIGLVHDSPEIISPINSMSCWHGLLSQLLHPDYL